MCDEETRKRPDHSQSRSWSRPRGPRHSCRGCGIIHQHCPHVPPRPDRCGVSLQGRTRSGGPGRRRPRRDGRQERARMPSGAALCALAPTLPRKRMCARSYESYPPEPACARSLLAVAPAAPRGEPAAPPSPASLPHPLPWASIPCLPLPDEQLKGSVLDSENPSPLQPCPLQLAVSIKYEYSHSLRGRDKEGDQVAGPRAPGRTPTTAGRRVPPPPQARPPVVCVTPTQR